jgi:hypothetical protein
MRLGDYCVPHQSFFCLICYPPVALPTNSPNWTLQRGKYESYDPSTRSEASVQTYQDNYSTAENCMSYCFSVVDSWGIIPKLNSFTEASQWLFSSTKVCYRRPGFDCPNGAIPAIFFPTSLPFNDKGDRDFHWVIYTLQGWAHKSGDLPSVVFPNNWSEKQVVNYFMTSNKIKYRDPLYFGIEI